jgi:hypothetical protein
MEACEAALEIEPEDAVALYNNIDALSMQERVEEAMDTDVPVVEDQACEATFHAKSRCHAFGRRMTTLLASPRMITIAAPEGAARTTSRRLAAPSRFRDPRRKSARNLEALPELRCFRGCLS